MSLYTFKWKWFLMMKKKTVDPLLFYDILQGLKALCVTAYKLMERRLWKTFCLLLKPLWKLFVIFPLLLFYRVNSLYSAWMFYFEINSWMVSASMATQLLLLAQISSNEIPDWLIHFIFQNEIITLITFASLLLSVHSAGSGNKFK